MSMENEKCMRIGRVISKWIAFMTLVRNKFKVDESTEDKDVIETVLSAHLSGKVMQKVYEARKIRNTFAHDQVVNHSQLR